jgi:hypothetical protein
MRDIEVIITESPVTERYVRAGMEGKIDTHTGQIQVNGCWWTLNDKWKYTINDIPVTFESGVIKYNIFPLINKDVVNYSTKYQSQKVTIDENGNEIQQKDSVFNSTEKHSTKGLLTTEFINGKLKNL